MPDSGYEILILPTSDKCWAWAIRGGGSPYTIAYGGFPQEDASYTDILFGVMILAWSHSQGCSLEKKWGWSPPPGCSKVSEGRGV